jgi:hypothetical protein
MGFNPCRQRVHIRGRDIIMGREGRGGPLGRGGRDFSFDGKFYFILFWYGMVFF